MSKRSPPGSDDLDRRRIGRYLAGEPEATAEVQHWILRTLDARFAFVGFDREDLCQMTHAKLVANLKAEKFRHGSALETYVSRVTEYTAIDFLRSRYREHLPLPLAPRETHDTHDVVVRRERRRNLHRAMHLCSERCRELWRLVLVEELSYTEIAERLGVAPGTVKSRVFRCRKQLDEVLERLGSGRGSTDPRAARSRPRRKEGTHDLP